MNGTNLCSTTYLSTNYLYLTSLSFAYILTLEYAGRWSSLSLRSPRLAHYTQINAPFTEKHTLLTCSLLTMNKCAKCVQAQMCANVCRTWVSKYTCLQKVFRICQNLQICAKMCHNVQKCASVCKIYRSVQKCAEMGKKKSDMCTSVPKCLHCNANVLNVLECAEMCSSVLKCTQVC